MTASNYTGEVRWRKLRSQPLFLYRIAIGPSRPLRVAFFFPFHLPTQLQIKMPRVLTVCTVLLLFGFHSAISIAANEGKPIRMIGSPSISPDGSRIAFEWNREIWLVDVPEDSQQIIVPKRLTQHPANDSNPVFSRDGKHIAFASNRTGSTQVFLMPTDGGAPIQKTFHSEGCIPMDFFPGDQYLLVSGARDHFWRSSQRLLKIDLQNRAAEQIVFDAYADDARLSSDGKKIFFSREGERWWRKGYTGERAAQVWEYSTENDEFTELLHEGVGCRWPMPMPNGRGIYFAKSDSNGWDLWKLRLATKGKPSKQTLVHAFENDAIAFPRISTDGSMIVFKHLFDAFVLSTKKGAKPIKLNLQLSGDIELFDDQLNETYSEASSVGFSQDGLDVAFTAGGNLWVMDTKLREPVQVTHTDGFESEPLFSNDGECLYFVATVNGQLDIWSAKRKDDELFWWQNSEFELEQITNDPEVESGLALSPKGDSIFFNRASRDLVRLDLETGSTSTIAKAFREFDFDISFDASWITYAKQDNEFNSDIWIQSLTDLDAEPINISRHPDNEFNPKFSPDGKMLVFTGRRSGEEYDIYYVYLQEVEAEKTRRARTIEEAIQLMEKKRKTSKKKSEDKPEASEKPAGDEPNNGDKNDKAKGSNDVEDSDSSPDEPDDQEPMDIDFENIHERILRIVSPDAFESNLLFSPNGKKLAFQSSINGKRGWYTVEFPDELTPKFFSDATGSQAVWTEEAGGVLLLRNGVPTKVSTSGSDEQFRFTAYQTRSQSGRFREGFIAAWRTMRDVWYDPAYNNNNWDAIRRKYEDAAAGAFGIGALQDVVELMLGELNGSHLGFTPAREARPETTNDDWQESTAHLGVRFDDEYQGPGLLVKDVVEGSPADRVESQLFPGDVIKSIDGTVVDPDFDLTLVLNGRSDREIELRVGRNNPSPDGANDDERSDIAVEEVTVVLRPMSYGAIRGLLYDQWVASNQATVAKASDGKLGYLHIRAMNQSSFLEFERQLFNVGYGREGIVIDVRDNGGGSTTDLLLTALTQPRHAITVPRNGGKGYPHDRKVFASWNKPIIVLCNQNSYSNAEIFSHAIKTLGRGKVVGVQTAGGVVSTGSATVSDVGRIRVPFRGWFLVHDGKDMERNGALPDVVIWPLPSEIPNGIDRQLEKAIEMLLVEVQEQVPDPELEYASQRKSKED